METSAIGEETMSGADPHNRSFSRNAAVLAIALVLCLGSCLARGQDGGSGTPPQSTTPSAQAPQEASALERARVVRVVDGDTLVVRLDDGSSRKVRLVGVDAPESVAEDASRNTPEGAQAASYTKDHVRENAVVWLQREYSDTDSYDRLLRHVWLEHPDSVHDEQEVRSKMLDAMLVDAGFARSKRYEPDTAYNDLFDSFARDAHEAGRGVSYLWN